MAGRPLRRLRNSLSRRSNPQSFEEQAVWLRQMSQLFQGRYQRDAADEVARFLAQHVALGVRKDQMANGLFRGATANLKREYVDYLWTPEDHLALVAFGLTQANRLRPDDRSAIYSRFVVYLDTLFGDTDPDESLVFRDLLDLLERHR